jgi:DNA-binding NtrC family response regulator
MSSIIVATASEEVRTATVQPLAREGFSVRPVADAIGLLRAVLAGETRLVLIDPDLPALDPGLVHSLAAALPSPPLVRILGRDAPPLARTPSTALALSRLARRATGLPGMDPVERRLLRWVGLGPDAPAALGRLATSPLPVLLHGERGTGKERIAAIVHRISGRGGPLVVLGADSPWAAGPRRSTDNAAVPGTLFLESVQRRNDVRDVIRSAQGAGWKVIAGSRITEAAPGVEWARVVIPPLRERPDDLRQLTLHYLDTHARSLGLPKRTFDRGMWALVHAHRWPGNLRELESFVVQTLHSVDAPVIRGTELPEALRVLLLPRADAVQRETESFEDMARVRLLPVVSAYQPGTVGTPSERSLHRLVVGSTERALIQLVLARTQGNRKAAAELLGVARNTLQARIEALGISASRE